MSHGEHAPKEHGSKVNLGRPPEGPSGPLPGTPEYDDLLKMKAAELVAEIKAMYPKLKGVWTQEDWFARAEKAGVQYIENTRRFIEANK